MTLRFLGKYRPGINNMSTGAILTVLSNIPWGQVIDNAPKVADGAAKLWGSVTSFRRKTAPLLESTTDAGASKLTEVEVLRAAVLDIEESIKIISGQMSDSSILIRDLAQQNTQLINRIELNQSELVKTRVVAIAFGILLTAAVIFLWFQH